MNADPSQEFSFKIQDEPPEMYLQADEEDRRIKKLNRRITRMAFFIPLLVGILVAAGYVDLKNRITRINSTEGQEIKALAKELDSRFITISEKQAALEKALGGEIDRSGKEYDALSSELKKTADAFNLSLNQTAETLEKTARSLAASKTDRQELDKAIGRFEKAVDPLEARLKAVSAEITSLDSNLTQELASVSGTVDDLNHGLSGLRVQMEGVSSAREMALVADAVDGLKRDLSKLKARVAGVSTGGIDPDYLDARLLKEQRIYQLKLDQAFQELKRKLATLQKTVSTLQKELSSLEETAAPALALGPASPLPLTASPDRLRRRPIASVAMEPDD